MRGHFPITICSLMLLLVAGGAVAGNQGDESRISGFAGISLGRFTVFFPGSGIGDDFTQVYGNRSGVSYSGHAGIGSGTSGLYGILKWRFWSMTGNPQVFGFNQVSGLAEWNQTFLSAGARYYLLSYRKHIKPFTPFLGSGIIYSSATEDISATFYDQGQFDFVDASASVSGTGFYTEIGLTVPVWRLGTVTLILEYSDINLGGSQHGQDYKLDGGGGVYIGLTVTRFFGRGLGEETDRTTSGGSDRVTVQ